MSDAIVQPFGEKAHKFITRDPGDDKKYTLLEGSVRSSKTFAIDVKLITKLCSYKVKGKRVICGASKQTVYKNMLLDIFAIVGTKNYKYNVTNGELWLFGTQWFVIGAKDEASYRNILGMTIGIAILDEWTQFPRSFTMQLFLRMSPKGSRLYASTNPDTPYHYLMQEVINNPAMKADIEVIHFTLADNPNIDKDERRRIEASQSGFFYQRYILGLWVIAEGAIYRDSLVDGVYYDDETRPIGLLGSGGYVERFIPIDYGTANQTVFLDVVDDGATYWVDDEWVWDSRKENLQKTDKQYADDLEKWLVDRRGAQVIIDPSAASFKAEMTQRGIWHCDAVNDVLDGIRTVSSLLAQRKLKIHKRCSNLIQQMQTYSWDEKAAKRGEEKPVKDNDHGPDALRYGAHTKAPEWRIAG